MWLQIINRILPQWDLLSLIVITTRMYFLMSWVKFFRQYCLCKLDPGNLSPSCRRHPGPYNSVRCRYFNLYSSTLPTFTRFYGISYEKSFEVLSLCMTNSSMMSWSPLCETVETRSDDFSKYTCLLHCRMSDWSNVSHTMLLDRRFRTEYHLKVNWNRLKGYLIRSHGTLRNIIT